MMITSAVLLMEITHELLTLLHKALKALGNSHWLNTKELSDEVLTKWTERKDDLTPSQDQAYSELYEAINHYQEGQGSQKATIEAIAMLPTMAFLDNEITHLTGHPLSDKSDDRARITIKDFINDHVQNKDKNKAANVDYLSQPLGEFNRHLMEDHFSPIVVPVRDNGELIGFCAPYTKDGNGHEMFIGLDDDRKSIVVKGTPVAANRISEEFISLGKIPLDAVSDHGFTSAGMFLEQVHAEIEKTTAESNPDFLKRLDAVAIMTAQCIEEQNGRALTDLVGKTKSVQEFSGNVLEDAFKSLPDAFPLRNIKDELQNFRLPFYDGENRIVNVNLPIKDVSEIDHIGMRVVTGDETGDIFLKNGQVIHFDTGHDRFVEKDIATYTIPNEALVNWLNLDMQNRTHQKASEERLNGIITIRTELKAQEPPKPFADRSTGNAILPDLPERSEPTISVPPARDEVSQKKKVTRKSKNEAEAQALLEKYTKQYADNKELVAVLSKDNICACLDELDANGKDHGHLDAFVDGLDVMPRSLMINPKAMITLYDYRSNVGAEKAFNRFVPRTAKALELTAKRAEISFNGIIKEYVAEKHQLLTQRTPRETIDQFRAERDAQERQQILESLEKIDKRIVIGYDGVDLGKTGRILPITNGRIDETIANSCVDLITEYGKERFFENVHKACISNESAYVGSKSLQLSFYEELQRAVFASKSDAEFSIALDEVFKQATEVFPKSFTLTPCEALGYIHKTEMIEEKIKSDYGDPSSAPKELQEKLKHAQNKQRHALDVKDGFVVNSFHKETISDIEKAADKFYQKEEKNQDKKPTSIEHNSSSSQAEIDALFMDDDKTLTFTFYNIDDRPLLIKLPVANLDEVDHISMKCIAYDETGDIFLKDGRKFHFDTGCGRVESEPIGKYEITHEALKQLDSIKLVSHADDPSQEKPLSEQRRIGVAVIQKRLDREAKQKQRSKPTHQKEKTKTD